MLNEDEIRKRVKQTHDKLKKEGFFDEAHKRIQDQMQKDKEESRGMAYWILAILILTVTIGLIVSFFV